MERFTRLDAVAVPMGTPDVNTDQIIPARYLQKPRREGLAPYLFRDLRFDEAGALRPDFILNRPEYDGAGVIVAERNFGCGSSREHAVYALWDCGIRAVIAPSFGDIFYSNCLKNGLLPIILAPQSVATLLQGLADAPGASLVVDLDAQEITAQGGETYRFEIDPFRRHCLLEGLDELSFTLGYRDRIAAFEESHAAASPWL